MDEYEWTLPLIGIIVGWILSEISRYFRENRDRKKRIQELKIAYYAEWLSGMRSGFEAYASQSGGNPRNYDSLLCEQRLLLIESDKNALSLMQSVHRSIPHLKSQDFEDLQLEVHSDPEWKWEPFEKSIDELIQHVRSKL